jgi:hypothetical protein
MVDVFGPTPLATAGVCVFGQGDCGPKVNNVSQSFNKTLSENIKNTLISKSTSIGAQMSSEQIIDFSGTDMTACDSIEFSGITQKAVLQYNFSMIDSAIDQTQFTNLIRENVEKSLDQNVQAKSEALNGGNTGVVNNISQTLTNSVNRLVNSINYNDFKNVMSEMRARQRIGFSGMRLGGKWCNFKNFSQDVMMELAAKMLSEKISAEFTQIAKENELRENTKSANTFMASGVLGDLGRGITAMTSSLFTGLGNLVGEFTKPMIMIGIVILVMIVAWIIYRALRSGKLEGFAKDEQGMERDRQQFELKKQALAQQPQRPPAPMVAPRLVPTVPTPQQLFSAQRSTVESQPLVTPTAPPTALPPAPPTAASPTALPPAPPTAASPTALPPAATPAPLSPPALPPAPPAEGKPLQAGN